MHQIGKPPQRGRPPRDPVDQLQTRIWIAAVAQASGWSAAQMEQRFDPDKVRTEDGVVVRPRKWDRYLAGKMSASDSGPNGSVAKAEALFPGTARWFRTPLWRALKTAPMAQEEVIALLRKLDAPISEMLFPVDPNGIERYFPKFDEDLRARLVDCEPWHALAAAILLSRFAVVISSPDLRDLAVAAYHALLRPVAELAPLVEHYPALFDLVDRHCKLWVFVSASERLDMMAFWQGVREHQGW